ncbi:MAG: hypothetical protein U7123_25160 [Potamolinea sp.]
MYSSESQQPSEQQQPANHLLRCQTALSRPDQLVCTTEATVSNLLPQLEPATLVEYGGITTAIILSLSIFIHALAEYNKVFIPVMLQKSDKKNE